MTNSSELIRQFVLEGVLECIESVYDLKVYELAMAEFLEDPVTYSLDQVERELGFQSHC